ncbi:MAG: YihY/virulence factor BrkB family protein [Candidatus Obscuribacterales bacterium]|nr:YihY/virulence factor BrkB family protein [Steroidobacteraceae bacterium]
MIERHSVIKKFRSAYRKVACAVGIYIDAGVSSEGAALAFYSAFALAPLLLIIAGLLGWLIGSERADIYVHEQLRQLVGGASGDVIFEAAVKARAASADQKLIASLLSVIAMLVGATTVFAEIQSALDRMWQASSKRRRGIVGWLLTRVWSFGLVLTIGFLLLISLAVSTWLAALRSLWSPALGDFTALTFTIDLLTSITSNTVLFAVVYRYLPAVRLPWRTVLQGGLITAFLFYLGRIAISIYLARAATTSFYGAAASFAVLLLWLYYSAQIFLFGAQFTACLGERQNSETPDCKIKEPTHAAT